MQKNAGQATEETRMSEALWDEIEALLKEEEKLAAQLRMVRRARKSLQALKEQKK